MDGSAECEKDHFSCNKIDFSIQITSWHQVIALKNYGSIEDVAMIGISLRVEAVMYEKSVEGDETRCWWAGFFAFSPIIFDQPTLSDKVLRGIGLKALLFRRAYGSKVCICFRKIWTGSLKKLVFSRAKCVQSDNFCFLGVSHQKYVDRRTMREIMWISSG